MINKIKIVSANTQSELQVKVKMLVHLWVGRSAAVAFPEIGERRGGWRWAIVLCSIAMTHADDCLQYSVFKGRGKRVSYCLDFAQILPWLAGMFCVCN